MDWCWLGANKYTIDTPLIHRYTVVIFLWIKQNMLKSVRGARWFLYYFLVRVLTTITFFDFTWWHHDIETISTLLALCEGTLCHQWIPFIKGQLCETLIFSLLQFVERAVELSVIWDAMALMWRHYHSDLVFLAGESNVEESIRPWEVWDYEYTGHVISQFTCILAQTLKA